MAANKKRLLIYSGLAAFVGLALMDTGDKSKTAALNQSNLAAFESLCLKNLVGIQADMDSQILFCRCSAGQMAHNWTMSEDLVKARQDFQKLYAEVAADARAQRAVASQQALLDEDYSNENMPFIEALGYPKPYPTIKEPLKNFLELAQKFWKEAQSSCLKD